MEKVWHCQSLALYSIILYRVAICTYNIMYTCAFIRVQG